jgi:iron complex outermembrane receptor protein
LFGAMSKDVEPVLRNARAMKGIRAIAAVTLLNATCPAAIAAAQTENPSTAAPADTTAPAAATPAKQDGLAEIVVTATRREANLQNVPVAVTALTGGTLDSAGVGQLRDLTVTVPGFTGGRNITVSQPVIRGVGSSGVSAGDESNVATYIDGVYQPDPYSTFIDLVQIDRVEVLRGPQGTVFGRNATGGLINIITPDPTFDFHGNVAGTWGRTRNKADNYDIRGYVTGGITDTLAIDFAALHRNEDGYIKDLVRGGTLGDTSVTDLRSKLLFQPTNRVRFVLTNEYARQISSMNSLQPFKGDTSAAQSPGVILPTGPWEASTTIIPENNFKRYNVALKGQVEFDGFNVETTSAYLHSIVHQATDGDSTNILINQNTADTKTDSYSQELRLVSANQSKLQWTAGVYAFRLTADQGVYVENGAAGGGTTQVSFNARVGTTSYAGFAEGTYEVAPSLFLTAGGRYTTEKRTFRTAVNGTPFPATGHVEKTFDKWTYRMALRYEFSHNSNVYVSYGTGFKSGVYNTLGASLIPVDPETIKALEGGLKVEPTRWLRTNLSIYHYDYNGLQVQARNSSGSYTLQNAAIAKIYGGEFEVTASPLEGLEINGSVAYNHGKYSSFPAAQTFTPLPQGGNVISSSSASGNDMIRAPRTTFNLGFNWEGALAGGQVAVSGNLFHSARVYYDFGNNFSQNPYTRANGRISWTPADTAWTFSVWGTNLTNSAVAQQIRPGAAGTDLVYEPPRRIGLGVQAKF